MRRNSKIFEIGVSIFLMLFSCFMLHIAITKDQPAGDGNLSAMAFPKVLYIIIILMCLYLIVTGVLALKKYSLEKDAAKVPMIPLKSIVTFVAIVIYAAMWKVIGFTLSTFCFFFFESFYLDRKKPLWLTIVLSIGATVIMYVVFGMFFKVSFPDKFMNMIRGI